MIYTPPPVEHVYQLSHDEKNQVLKSHFQLFWQVCCECQLTPEAGFGTVGEVKHFATGIRTPFMNAVIGGPSNRFAACIDEAMQSFQERSLPFAWYVDEKKSPEFEQALVDNGFQDAGVFQGVIGILDRSLLEVKVPEGCQLQLVEDDALMEKFSVLVCDTFEMKGEGMRELVQQCLADIRKKGLMFHWVALKNGEVISAISTFIDGNAVSFWNGATRPEARNGGVSSALRRLALQHAMKQGAQVGMSFLMSEGMAFGICQKLGYETEWRFHAFVAP